MIIFIVLKQGLEFGYRHSKGNVHGEQNRMLFVALFNRAKNKGFLPKAKSAAFKKNF